MRPSRSGATCALAALFLLLLALSAAPPTQAQADPPVLTPYTILDHPDAGTGEFQGTVAFGLNNRGQVVGGYLDSNNREHGFVYEDGVYTPLNHPDAGTGTFQGTAAIGINDRGQIVGYYVDNPGWHGFIYDKGDFTTLDHPDATFSTWATGINNRGQVVGTYLSSDGQRGFVYEDGIYTTISHPDANAFHGGTSTWGINDRGQIVGSYWDSDGQPHSFVYADGVLTLLPESPANPTLLAKGINDRGQIAGAYPGFPLPHLFLYDDGVYTTLPDPPGQLSPLGVGFNDRGQIVGSYFGSDSRNHGFLATPKDDIDATDRVRLTRGGLRLNRATGRFVQQLHLNNTSDQPVVGPLSVTLDELPAGVTLANQTGMTEIIGPLGRPYVNTAGNLAPGATRTVVLEFANPDKLPITYSVRVLAGPLSR